MDEVQVFFLVMLIPPAIVLLTATLPARARRQQARLDVEGFLILATAPQSISQVFILQRLFFRFDFRWWPCWFWFVYFSIALALSFRVALLRWNGIGWTKQCELAFSLLYFGIHWLLYALGTFIGIPPL